MLLVALTAVLASAKEHKGHVAHKEHAEHTEHKEHKEHKEHTEQKSLQHPVMERAEEAKPLSPFVPFVYPWWDSTATAKYGEAWKDMRNKFTALVAGIPHDMRRSPSPWLACPHLTAFQHGEGPARHVPAPAAGPLR